MDIKAERSRILENIKNSVASKKLELDMLRLEAEEIAKRLSDARDAKDFSENSAYDIAIEERTRNDKQIAVVQDFINSYASFLSVCEKDERSQYVKIGSVVVLETSESSEQYVFMLVPDSLGDGGARALSVLSHAGKVILGKPKGTEVVVRTSVKTYKCKILEVY